MEGGERVLLSRRRVLLCHVGDSGGVIGSFCGAGGCWNWWTGDEEFCEIGENGRESMQLDDGGR